MIELNSSKDRNTLVNKHIETIKTLANSQYAWLEKRIDSAITAEKMFLQLLQSEIIRYELNFNTNYDGDLELSIIGFKNRYLIDIEIINNEYYISCISCNSANLLYGAPPTKSSLHNILKTVKTVQEVIEVIERIEQQIEEEINE